MKPLQLLLVKPLRVKLWQRANAVNVAAVVVVIAVNAVSVVKAVSKMAKPHQK